MLLPRLGKLTDEPDVRILIESDYVYRIFYRVDGSNVNGDPDLASFVMTAGVWRIALRRRRFFDYRGVIRLSLGFGRSSSAGRAMHS